MGRATMAGKDMPNTNSQDPLARQTVTLDRTAWYLFRFNDWPWSGEEDES